jgi:hypothetical protein
VTFRELRTARMARTARFHALITRLTAGYQADLAADFRRVYPRKHWHLGRISECLHRDSILAHWQIKADTAQDALDEDLTRIQAAMVAAAVQEAIPRTKSLRLLVRVSASTYHTQGFGASRYAKAEAEQQADQARLSGVPVEVRPVGKPRTDRWGVQYQDYGVFAPTNAVGWEMLRLRPGPSLREWIRGCWARQVNPRVYNPWLPAGLEDRLGLDYFGNDLRPVGTPPVPG